MTADERDHYYLLASAKTRLVLACSMLLETRNDLEIVDSKHQNTKDLRDVLRALVDVRDNVFDQIEKFVDVIVDRDGDE